MRGLGQDPASFFSDPTSSLFDSSGNFSLPPEGDTQAQANTGANLSALINQAASSGGDPAALAMAGISFLRSELVGSSNGAGGVILGLASSATEGALAGSSVAGPIGAAIGAAVGLVTGILSDIFGGAGPDTIVGVAGVSQATSKIGTMLSRMLQQFVPIEGVNSYKPQGWSMANYFAVAGFGGSANTSVGQAPYVGCKTKNTAQYMAMLQNIGQFLQSDSNDSFASSMMSSIDGPSNIANALNGAYTAQDFANFAQPLCTPVWFDYTNANKIVDCNNDLYFGSGGTGSSSLSTLKAQWVASTYPNPPLTQEEIVEAAIAKAPDPLYWCADLYGVPTSSGGGYATYICNPDLINGVSTVLYMRSIGASTQAIVSELLLQQHILQLYGNVDLSGQPLSGIPQNRYGFQKLVDDHIAMAKAEGYYGRAQNPVAISPPSYFWSSWNDWEIAAALAGTLGVGGVLGYSVYKRQSPLMTLQAMKDRVRAKVGTLRAPGGGGGLSTAHAAAKLAALKASIRSKL